MKTPSVAIGQFAIRHRLAIAFVSAALCLAGIYAAFNLPSSVFPQTNFPRVVIMVDNGVMPADEMMATVTRPIEEVMKDIPGAVRVRSTTGRGSAEISVFFTWNVDMVQAELHVDARLSQIRATLPATVSTSTRRLTFSAFPILGVSLTSPTADDIELWEMARYEIKPRFLRIPGVARVDLVGGRTPEYHVIVDPLRLQAANLTLAQVTDALSKNNQITPTGMHEENHTLYLAVVDGRVHNMHEIENLIVTAASSRVVRIKDFARVERGPEPAFNVVTAEGVAGGAAQCAQPAGRQHDRYRQRPEEGHGTRLKRELPPDVKTRLFLRPVAFCAGIGRQCLGCDSLRADPLGGDHLPFPEELGHDPDGDHCYSRDGAGHSVAMKADRAQPEHHDAGRHRGGNRVGD